MDERLRNALKAITEQQSGRDLIDAGRIEAAGIAGDTATIIVKPPVAGAPDLNRLQPQIEDEVSALDGIERVRVVMTAHRESKDRSAPAAKQTRKSTAPTVKPAKRIIATVVSSGPEEAAAILIKSCCFDPIIPVPNKFANGRRARLLYAYDD